MPTKSSARRSTGARKRASVQRSSRAGKSERGRPARGASAARSKSAGKTAGKTARKGAGAKSARSAAPKGSGRPTPERPSKGISRIDQPSRRTHGFFVRLDYRKTPDGYRPRLVAFFGDASHGGKRAAWKAAEEWADRNRRGIKRAGATKRRAS